jgi:DNA replication licensing factor MCM5
MSGWDEGAVFYSDQAQFPRGGPGGDPSADLTRHSALRKFKEFLRGFTGPTGDFPYRYGPPSHSPNPSQSPQIWRLRGQT